MNCANHPDRERVAFCQNCGKPLCVECSRVVGQAVFCEPCLAARLAGTGSFPGASAASAGAAPRQGAGPNVYSGTIPPPAAPGEPNPGLAALLGFIPGVGAFYNGQYAKGVVHLIVFAVLISLADQHGIFGLFIAGWIFYQVIEAHHTARARRDGTPLPNPFGLNDLSERLGFGKSWPSAGTPGSAGYGTPPTAGEQGTGYVPPGQNAYASTAAQTPYGPTAGASNWGSPEETYAPTGQPPFSSNPTGAAAGQAYPGAAPPYAAVPPASPYSGPFAPDYMAQLTGGRRLPTGAFVLIGLGSFFLLANTGRFGGLAIQWLVPFFLVGIGIWIFVRRMTSTGHSLGDDGSAGYRFRLYTALSGSIWPALVGLLFLLDLTHTLSWSHSWPLIIVVAGVLALLKRTAYTSVPVAPFPGVPTVPMGGPVQASGPSAAATETARANETPGDRS